MCLRQILYYLSPLLSDALNSINYITLFMPGCIFLRMDTFLPQCAGRFEVNWDMMFTEDEFLRYCRIIRNDAFSSSLSALDLLEVLTKVQFG